MGICRDYNDIKLVLNIDGGNEFETRWLGMHLILNADREAKLINILLL